MYRRSPPESLKIALVGTGSIGFTRLLMHDLLTVSEFAETTFALMDISQCAPDTVLRPARSPAVGCIKFYFLKRPVRTRMPIRPVFCDVPGDIGK